jgi:hypothetical protein
MTHRPLICAKRWKRKRTDQIRIRIHGRVGLGLGLYLRNRSPGVGEDDPKNRTHRLDGRRVAKKGQMGTRTHIITEIKRGDREKAKREAQREGIK